MAPEILLYFIRECEGEAQAGHAQDKRSRQSAHSIQA